MKKWYNQEKLLNSKRPVMNINPPIYTMSKEEIITELFDDSKNKPLNDEALFKYARLGELLKGFPIRKYRICFIQPPQVYPDYIVKDVARNKRYLIYFPYGLLALSAAIRMFNNHWEVIIKDLHLELVKRSCNDDKTDFDSLLATLPDDCDVYGISYMQSTSERQVLKITDYLKSKEKFVIAGGVQCTTGDYFNLLKTNAADICLLRESETQIVKLLNFWEESCKGKSMPSAMSNGIVNLSFNSGGQIISFDNVYESVVSLDVRQEYDKINIDDYNTYGSAGVWARTAGKSRKFANIMSNRGCKGKCTFCSVSIFMKHGVRSRATQDVLDEILYLYHKKGIRHIEWLDDDLLGNKERSLDLYNRLSALNLDLTWSTNHYVHASPITEELALAMVNSGCVMTGFGVETGNEKRLRSLRKAVNKKIIRRAVNIFRKNHPQVTLATTWIFGFPNETFGELFESFNFARELKVDWCTNSVLQPLPGTSIYEELRQLGDERTVDQIGKRNSSVYTIGREVVSKGQTFDDIFKDIIDFRTVDLDAIATKHEIQQFQIYFNVFVNLLGNVNLTSEGNPEKIRRHTADILKGYKMDAVAWFVNAKASKMLGLIERYDDSMKNYEIALKQSVFWNRYFKLYDIPKYFN